MCVSHAVMIGVFMGRVQEKAVLPSKIPALCVQLFLATYNCEVNRVDVLTLIFDSFLMVNSMDMTLRILGQLGSNIGSDNVMFDLCTILHTVVIRDDGVLLDAIVNGAWGKPAQPVKIHALDQQSRPSLTAILELQKKHTIAGTGGYDACIPPDMPLNEVCWLSKSSAQQQIILLIICIRPMYIESRHVFITSLFGNVTRPEIDGYTVKAQRMQPIIDATLPILQKINANVDFSNAELRTTIHSFTESCFKGIFGEAHKSILTLPFFVLMYIIAYLEPPMQAKFYQSVVAAFNRRLEHTNKDLTIPTYMSQNLVENMTFWCTREHFSVADISSVLQTVCI